MKRILISAVLALALAGTTAFAAESKNAPAKKPVAKPAAAATTMSGAAAKKPAAKKHKKHKKHAKAKAKPAPTMTPKKP